MNDLVITINNTTKYDVSGTILYEGPLHHTDVYSAAPNETWQTTTPENNPVAEISAIVKTPNGGLVATPYRSYGSSRVHFAICEIEGYLYEVTLSET